MTTTIEFKAWLDSPLTKAMKQNHKEAVLAEREACAKLLEGGSFLHDQSPAKLLADEAAKAIRARSKV